jgi:DNA-directed RNA polymerase
VAAKADALLTKQYWVTHKVVDSKGKEKYCRETFATKEEADSFAVTVDVVRSGHVDIAIDRDIAKQPVSTFYFGATRYGTVDQVRDALEKKGIRFGQDEPGIIAAAIYSAVKDAVPAAAAVYEFMSELAGLYADAGKYLTWTVPTGFQVISLGRGGDESAKTYEGRLAGRRKRVKLIKNATKPDKQSAMQCATANLIHSLDAALAAMVVTAAAEEDYVYQAGIPMAIVHDCFAAPAPRAGRLRDTIGHQMFALYNPNVMLQRIYEAAVRDLPNVEIPTPPPLGSFDIIGVKQNFFAFKS